LCYFPESPNNRGNSQIAQRTHIMENMKLKVKITGPRVHDVGYRYFLMSNAMDLGLKGFHARNRMSGEEQEVIVLVEGDEEAIADFGKLVETKKPEHSKVSNIAFQDYEGDVMRAGEYAQVCTALQMNKAIPLLLKIQNNTSVTPQILEEIKDMREDIQPGYGMNFRQVQSDVLMLNDGLERWN
jgi:acylphosphatase